MLQRVLMTAATNLLVIRIMVSVSQLQAAFVRKLLVLQVSFLYSGTTPAYVNIRTRISVKGLG